MDKIYTLDLTPKYIRAIPWVQPVGAWNLHMPEVLVVEVTTIKYYTKFLLAFYRCKMRSVRRSRTAPLRKHFLGQRICCQAPDKIKITVYGDTRSTYGMEYASIFIIATQLMVCGNSTSR